MSDATIMPEQPRRWRMAWRLALVCALALGFTGITLAVGNPGYLAETSVSIPAGSKSYQIWYTTDCDGTEGCDCDKANDTDTSDPPDGTLDADSSDSCLATVDDDLDGVFDSGLDDDNDGVLNIVDLDWVAAGPSVVESIPLNVQKTVNRYVNDWELKEPYWNTGDTDRPIYVYNIDARGYAAGNGEDYDAGVMKGNGPEPRGTVLHELWHNTQFAYDIDTGLWLLEGQARYMQDKVFDDLDNLVASRYHNSVNAYLGNTTWLTTEDRDEDGTDEFDQPKGLLGASYDASLWWTYLSDQAGTKFGATAGDGVDLLQAVLEQSSEDGRQGVDATNRVLLDRIGQGFDATFWDFVIANYAKDFDLAKLPASTLGGRDPQQVLKYSDEKRTGADILIYGPVERQVISASDMMAGVNGSLPAAAADLNDATSMPAYGVNYYEGAIGIGCQLPYWRVTGQDDSSFMHSALLITRDTNGDTVEEVVDLQRSQGQDFARAVWNGLTAGGPGYSRLVGIVATGAEAAGYQWEMGCATPQIAIVEPEAASPAYVGAPTEPGRFMVWTSVTGAPGSSTYVAGLEWQRDFVVRVGADQATILNGGYVQDQYWLLVQAPVKAAAPLGATYDLTVQLGPMAGVSATEAASVVYDIRATDQVLVIDHSGSMADNSKMESAKVAARMFADASQKFDMLGVVSFSDDATLDYPLTMVPDQNDAGGVRAAARAKIDALSAGGMTSIGDGLQTGQNELNAKGLADHVHAMVLLSDGQETAAAYWSAVRAAVVPADTLVHAIALGQDADEDLMRDIAESTCGAVKVDQCYHFIEESGVGLNKAAAASPLANGLADIYRRSQERLAGHQRLWQGGGVMAAPQSIVVTIGDNGVRDAIWSFNWNDSAAPLAVSITPPAGVIFTQLADGKNHRVFTAPKLLPGAYTINLSGAGSTWIGSLSGRLIKGAELHAFIDNTWADRRPGMPIRLQASLSADAGPVRGATVTARVRHPDGDISTVRLVDDGGIYDERANDGVYGYVYDRINRPLSINKALGHSWVFDITSSHTGPGGVPITRYARLTFTPAFGREVTVLDMDNDGMLDVWENRFAAAQPNNPNDWSADPDGDGLNNRAEFERGTNPDSPDTDRGGETDGSEATAGRDPLFTADDEMQPLTDVWAENQPGSVVLHFNPSPDYTAVRAYRSTNAQTGFALINPAIVDLARGRLTDQNLTNDQDYFYMLQPVGASNVAGPRTPAFYAEPALDPYEPETDVLINNDRPFTASKNVTLSFGGMTLSNGDRNVRSLQISNKPDLHSAAWVPFKQTMPWTIEPDAKTGAAFVYVRFRDMAGNVSDVIYGDGIRFKPLVAFPAGNILLDKIKLNFTKAAFNGWMIGVQLLSYPSLDPSGGALSRGQANEPLFFAGLSFTVALTDEAGMARQTTSTAFGITVEYEDWQWRDAGIDSEESLGLYRRVGRTWELVPLCSSCVRDTAANTLTVESFNAGEYALLGAPRQPQRVYLPILMR